jgi:uncharacterized protein YecE (DUF72 family)
MTIRIGTASWSHPALIDSGRFYPLETMSAQERLRFYTTQFPLVEVDASYYAISAPAVARQWAERTPAGFVMNAKAFRLFTGHQTSPKSLPADIAAALPEALRSRSILYYQDVPPELRDTLWSRFRDSLAPLREAGRLGMVHFQFPPWVLCNRAGVAHLEHCVERMQGQILSVEFRNASWFEGAQLRDTLNLQRSLGVAHTIVDSPQGFQNSVPAVWEATHASHALLRMHGRNERTWNHRVDTSSGRFNYEYDDAELEGVARQISGMDRPSLNLHVVMNNNAEDFAQANGRRLFDMLQSSGADVVVPFAHRAVGAAAGQG